MHGGHPHPEAEAPPATPEAEARYQAIKRVTLVGSVIDFILGVLKVFVGWLANSQSLMADGIHSFSDLATDFIVLYAAKHGSQAADEEHPYGHGKFETLATAALGVALIAVAIGIGWDAITRLFEPERLLVPGIWALIIALLSVGLKEWIYHYSMRIAQKFRSSMLEANAWHSRTDAISSIVVVIGVGGTMLGLEYLDAIAAVGVAFMVAKIGWDLSWSSMNELAESSLESDRVEKIRHAIRQVEGVRQMHMLRSRKVGHSALVDVHVQVDPWLSVSEGHMIAVAVENAAMNSLEEVTDVTVHIDPEDDEEAPSCEKLPNRNETLKILEKAWEDTGCSGKWQRIQLHYINGQIDVDVFLSLSCLLDKQPQLCKAEEVDLLVRQFQVPLEHMPEFGKVSINFSL